jgi:precorrin-3B methylase
MCAIEARLALPAQSDLIVAIATIHQSLFVKLEGDFVWTMYAIEARLALSAQSDLIVAIATIHQSPFVVKLEGDFVLHATLSIHIRKV